MLDIVSIFGPLELIIAPFSDFLSHVSIRVLSNGPSDRPAAASKARADEFENKK